MMFRPVLPRTLGAGGAVKHAGLMYWRRPWRPDEGLVREQPGTRSKIAYGSDMSWPLISLVMVKGQTGTPSLRVRIPPTSHPLAMKATGPWNDAGVGTSHRRLTTRLRETLKSDRPLINFKSHQGMVGFRSPAKLSPAKLPEVVSMVLLQVNETSACKPWLMRFSSSTWRALYQDLLCQIVDWIPATLGLISSPGTIPVGLVLKLAGRPRAASVWVQSGGPGRQPLPTGVGNTQRFPTFVGKTILRSSVWYGLCFAREPA